MTVRARIAPLRMATLVAVAATAVQAASAAAQRSGCTLLDDPNRTVSITNRGTLFETWFITDAVLDCPDGRNLVARNATYAVGTGQITMTGNVRIDDPDRTLTSEFAQYFSQSQQLHARTNVVLTEKRNGSVITSELLDVYQASEQRPDGLVIASGGSPRAIVYRETEEAVRDSTILEAREIRIIGEQSFRGTGEAVMRRDSLTAMGSVIEYSDVARQLEVMGGASVVLPAQELRGDSITATLDEQDEIRDVLARRGASLQAEDMDVVAPAIRLFFEDGGISRLVAMDWDSAAVVHGSQPRVTSDMFRMQADSIDVLAPDQQVSAAVAMGNAYGERVIPDSLRTLLPQAAPEVLALLSADWVRGDTVRARFAPNPAAETDPEADATVMEQLTAHGDQAQSMYSVRDQAQPDAMLSFNYLRSTYIEVNFAEGVVTTVFAAGDARGVYVQPAEAARARDPSGATPAVAPPPGGAPEGAP